jgi:hypothetical protein
MSLNSIITEPPTPDLTGLTLTLCNALAFTCGARSALSGATARYTPERTCEQLLSLASTSSVGLSGKCEQVCTRPYQRAIPFDLAEESKHLLAYFSLSPYFVEVL